MAKRNTDDADAAPPPAPAPAPPWRTVALCHTACNVHFGGQLIRLLGGEWVTEPDRVATIRGCEQFQFFDVTSPEQLASIMTETTTLIEQATKQLADLGYVVVRHGTPLGVVVAPHRAAA